MEGSKSSDHSTPSRRFVSSVHERFSINNIGAERFSHLRTPPSRLGKIKNPFDSLLYDKLHTHFSSPNFFKPSTPKCEDFSWTIEELSNLNPAVIDEEVADQYEVNEGDAVLESFVQSKIDRFFSMSEIIPSPFTQTKQTQRLIKDSPSSLTSFSPDTKPMAVDNTCQTTLTLPPVLPKAVEEILAPYFTYTCNQQGGELAQGGSLYRQLFEDEAQHDDEHDEIEEESPHAIDLVLSPMNPPSVARGYNQRFSHSMTPEYDGLKDCTLSPVGDKAKEASSSVRLNFSSHMSIDMSYNVPDNSRLSHNKSVNDESMNVNEGTVNCNDDFNDDTRSIGDEMDVSNSNTPKKRIFSSQRKKLSNSFEADEDIENDYFRNEKDSGYQGGHSSSEEIFYSSSLIASTPTKRK